MMFIAAVAVHAALLNTNTRDLADDAMISARYAKNLADGHGLRYNRAPADAAPVEGYSNFLWVTGMAAGFKAGLTPRASTAALGAACSIATVLLLGIWIGIRTRSWLAAAIGALVLGTYTPFAVWAAQGLETPMFALFALLPLALVDPQKPRPLVWLAALPACLTRPDGLLVPAAILAAHLLSRERDYRAIAGSSLAFVIPFAAYTLWRVHHFGALVPNVFHAKTGLGLAGVAVGVSYLIEWAVRNLAIAVLLIIVPAVLALRKRLGTDGKSIAAPALMLLFYFGFIVSVGGDFMPDHRMVIHVLPLMVGAGIIALTGHAPGAAPGRAKVAALAFVISLCLGQNSAQTLAYKSEDYAFQTEKSWHRNQASWYGPAAEWLRDRAGKGKTIACGDIGYIGFLSDADRIIDTNGLVDPYLARLPGAAMLRTDPDYVLDLKPDFLVVMVNIFEGGITLGHSAFDRAVLSGERLGREFEKAADLPGWRWQERSFDDGRVRSSEVRFLIYRRRS